MAWMDGKKASIYIWDTSESFDKNNSDHFHYAVHWDLSCNGTLLQIQDDSEDGDGYIHTYVIANLFKFKVVNNDW